MRTTRGHSHEEGSPMPSLLPFLPMLGRDQTTQRHSLGQCVCVCVRWWWDSQIFDLLFSGLKSRTGYFSICL